MTEKITETPSVGEMADILLSEEKIQNEQIKNLPLSKLVAFENQCSLS